MRLTAIGQYYKDLVTSNFSGLVWERWPNCDRNKPLSGLQEVCKVNIVIYHIQINIDIWTITVCGRLHKPSSGQPSVSSTWTTSSWLGSRSSQGSGVSSCSGASPSSTSSCCSTSWSPWWTTATSSSPSAR